MSVLVLGFLASFSSWISLSAARWMALAFHRPSKSLEHLQVASQKWPQSFKAFWNAPDIQSRVPMNLFA
jgi:hypothetical protein